MNDLRGTETRFGHFFKKRFGEYLRQLIGVFADMGHGVADGLLRFLR